MRCGELLSSIVLALLCGCHASSGLGLGDDAAMMDPDAAVAVDSAPAADLSGPQGLDLTGFDGALTPLADNVVPISVDTGASQQTFDVGFISVKICAPGTTTCQTIDHIIVDTGSVGMRIISSQIDPTLLAALPNVKSTVGNALGECYVYADGFVSGTIRNADLTIGGETAPNMEFHVLGDITTPAGCTQTGQSDNTVQAFGGNGIIGIAGFPHDCGMSCTMTATTQNPMYYDCPTTSTCAITAVATDQQVQNPVTLFPTDNNGVVVQMPQIDDNTGAKNPQGRLTFGVGTQSNNQITTEKIYTTGSNRSLATLHVSIGGAMSRAVLDTGTSLILATLSGVPTCVQSASLYCPTSIQDVTVAFTDSAMHTGSEIFRVANAVDLLSNNGNSTAFNDVVGPAQGQLTILGMPYFFGRRIFFAIDGATTLSGNGPFYAF